MNKMNTVSLIFLLGARLLRQSVLSVPFSQSVSHSTVGPDFSFGRRGQDGIKLGL